MIKTFFFILKKNFNLVSFYPVYFLFRFEIKIKILNLASSRSVAQRNK